MLRRTAPALGSAYILACDTIRLEDIKKLGRLIGNHIKIDFPGNRLNKHDFQLLCDKEFKKHSKQFVSVEHGAVYDRNFREVSVIEDKGRYVVTGSMGGGFVRNDHKFGLRLTGFRAISANRAGSLRPGLPWAGDKV